MPFLDTNLLISFVFVNDANHTKARKLIEELRGPLLISPWALFEIYAVVPRRIIPEGGFQLPEPLREILDRMPDDEDKLRRSVEVVVSFLKNALPLTLCSDEESPELGELEEVCISDERIKLLRLHASGMGKAGRVRLKASDLLHLVYVHALSKRGYPPEFATLDRDFRRKADLIKQEFGVEILWGEDP